MRSRSAVSLVCLYALWRARSSSRVGFSTAALISSLYYGTGRGRAKFQVTGVRETLADQVLDHRDTHPPRLDLGLEVVDEAPDHLVAEPLEVLQLPLLHERGGVAWRHGLDVDRQTARRLRE